MKCHWAYCPADADHVLIWGRPREDRLRELWLCGKHAAEWAEQVRNPLNVSWDGITYLCEKFT